MLIKCPECHNEISDNALSCPKCGYVLKKEKRNGYSIVFVILFILTCIGFCSSPDNNYKSRQVRKDVSNVTLEQRKKQFANIDVELIYDKRRTGEKTDFLLYKGQDKSDKKLAILVKEIKKISPHYFLYDDVNVLELNWLLWGAAFEKQEYYKTLEQLVNKCGKCYMDKHYISADFLITADGLTQSYKNKQQCGVCNIDVELQKFKKNYNNLVAK